MPRPKKDVSKALNVSNVFNIENCFGFDECDRDLDLWNNSSVLNDTNVPLEFQPNKPYRLALYVRPSQQRRLAKTSASILVKTLPQKQTKSRKNENHVSFKLSNENEAPKKTKRKENSASILFKESTKKEPKKNKTIEGSLLEKEISLTETSGRKSILREINTRPVTKSKQNKIRRSYERKCKQKDTEVIQEPPSEEIIKEIEIKKLSRTKPKKTVKEDQEFENWAKHMNSDFNDVDKFELSITYD